MKVTDEMVERGKGPLWSHMDDVEDAPPSSALVREILEAALANVPEPDIIHQEHRRMADELRQLQDAEVASRRRAEAAEARVKGLQLRLDRAVEREALQRALCAYHDDEPGDYEYSELAMDSMRAALNAALELP